MSQMYKFLQGLMYGWIHVAGGISAAMHNAFMSGITQDFSKGIRFSVSSPIYTRTRYTRVGKLQPIDYHIRSTLLFHFLLANAQGTRQQSKWRDPMP